MIIPAPNNPNTVRLSKLTISAQQVREIIDGCLKSLEPDDVLHYELGDLLAGPNLEKRFRVHHFLQMTLPGKPVLEKFDDFSTTDSEYDPESRDNYLDYLSVMRRTSLALGEGDYYSLTLKNPDVFGFVRQTELQRMVVMVNCSNRLATVKTPALTGRWVAGTDWVTGSGENPNGEIVLDQYEGRLFESRKALT